MSNLSLDDVSILLVDDEPEMLDFLEQFLRDCGARVSVAHSARTALAAIELATPDVVISDIGMPGDDGYWLIRAVRALPCERGGATVAIAMTGDVITNARERVLDAGFDEVRAKPFDLEELADLIARLVAADNRCRT
ncbi:MAG: response regulator [Candidatus Rokuibacteriota bacterium]